MPTFSKLDTNPRDGIATRAAVYAAVCEASDPQSRWFNKTHSYLAAAAGVSPAAFNYHLTKLRERGVLDTVRHGRRVEIILRRKFRP